MFLGAGKHRQLETKYGIWNQYVTLNELYLFTFPPAECCGEENFHSNIQLNCRRHSSLTTSFPKSSREWIYKKECCSGDF